MYASLYSPNIYSKYKQNGPNLAVNLDEGDNSVFVKSQLRLSTMFIKSISFDILTTDQDNWSDDY